MMTKNWTIGSNPEHSGIFTILYRFKGSKTVHTCDYISYSEKFKAWNVYDWMDSDANAFDKDTEILAYINYYHFVDDLIKEVFPEGIPEGNATEGS